MLTRWFDLWRVFQKLIIFSNEKNASNIQRIPVFCYRIPNNVTSKVLRANVHLSIRKPVHFYRSIYRMNDMQLGMRGLDNTADIRATPPFSSDEMSALPITEKMSDRSTFGTFRFCKRWKATCIIHQWNRVRAWKSETYPM